MFIRYRVRFLLGLWCLVMAAIATAEVVEGATTARFVFLSGNPSFYKLQQPVCLRLDLKVLVSEVQHHVKSFSVHGEFVRIKSSCCCSVVVQAPHEEDDKVLRRLVRVVKAARVWALPAAALAHVAEVLVSLLLQIETCSSSLDCPLKLIKEAHLSWQFHLENSSCVVPANGLDKQFNKGLSLNLLSRQFTTVDSNLCQDLVAFFWMKNLTSFSNLQRVLLDVIQGCQVTSRESDSTQGEAGHTNTSTNLPVSYYSFSKFVVLQSPVGFQASLVHLVRIITSDTKFRFSLVNYHTQAITGRSSTRTEVKKENCGFCCHVFKAWVEGVHIEDVRASLFRLFHRR